MLKSFLYIFLALILIGGFFLDSDKEIEIEQDQAVKVDMEEEKKLVNKNERYLKCYGEMTAAHKARGFHQNAREISIKVKERICEAYGNGEDLNYEGKK